jgi:hypothetical protein
MKMKPKAQGDLSLKRIEPFSGLKRPSLSEQVEPR